MHEILVPEDLRPHVPSYICGKCRKPIEKGHRILTARIAEGKGHNPNNINETGLNIRDEFEIVHVDCTDPLLKKGLT